MGKDTVAILLSTYNGELYLKQQIDSILIQDFKNWNLFIRDDGSNDATVKIIKQYSNDYHNIHFIEDQKRLGAAQSFMYLLKSVEADYYMFCDQDDVWYDNNISTKFNRIKKIESYEIGSPILIFSDATVVDQDLNVINSSFWQYNKIAPNLLLSNSAYINVYNSAPGCTMIFNNHLKGIVKDRNDEILMHDWYLMIIALKYGKVEISKKSLIMYRQHSSNVVGAKKISLLNRFLKIFRVKKLIKEQCEVFRFVGNYSKIGLLEFYKLKILFNIYRYKKH